MGEPWRTIRLSDVAHVEMGQSPPSSFVFESSDGGVPFLQGNADFTDRYPQARQFCTKSPKVAEAGDLLISVRAPVGAINEADQRYCIGRGLAAVRFTGVDPAFGFHALSYYSRSLRRVAQGTTFEAVGGADLREVEIPQCTRREQLGMAAILGTLNEAIRTGEKVIAKLKLMKLGLLRDLLTRGIQDSGELRPSPKGAPSLYRDSFLGRVPSEWAVGTLQDTVNPARPIVYGILMPGTGFLGGVPVVKVKNIIGGRIEADDLLLTSPAIDEEYRRSRLAQGDLLFTIRGTVGRTAFVPAWLNGANITQDTARVSINSASPQFVRYYLEMPVPRRFIEIHTIGQAVKGINLRDLRRVPLALPPVPEQEAMANVLRAADLRIDAEAATLLKLRILGQGVRDDILTGRVRVVVPEEAEV